MLSPLPLPAGAGPAASASAGMASVATDEATKKQWLANLEGFEKRKRELTALVDAAPKNGRIFGMDWASLGSDVKDDPKLKELVLKIEPTPAPH